MTSASSRIADDVKDMATDAKDTAQSEIAALRKKVEALMADRVSPALAEVAGQAEALAHGAKDTVKRQTDNLATTVRAQPFAAVGAAALAGLAIGLLIRR